MDRIRDLRGTDGRDDDMLTAATGGLFETAILSGEPPVTYLDEDEQPRYILRNKKSGVTVEGGGNDETVQPDGNHQALAVVTDVRVLVLIGRADGDEMRAVDLDDVVTASAESSGLLQSTLRMETVDDRTLAFPCRGNVSEAAAVVDDAAGTWARAVRLTEDAKDAFDACESLLDDREFETARRRLEEGVEAIRTAQERIERLGPAAHASIEDTVADLRERGARVRRTGAATEGGYHHAAGQRAWDDHDFERAAAAYDAALDGYERALAIDADTPPAETLRARLQGVAAERELLRAAPTAEARAARGAAADADDPATAADRWEQALGLSRTAATIAWGDAPNEFVVDRETARERASEAADRAIDSHVDAARGVLGDDSVDADAESRERARAHLADALAIARELHPERCEGLRDRLSQIPAKEADESEADAGVESDTADEAEPTGGSEERPDGREQTDDIDHRDGVPGPAVQSSEAPAEAAAAATGDDGRGAEAHPSSGRVPASGTASESDGADADTLRSLGREALTDLVADTWEAEGWATTVFAGGTDAVYDIVGIRPGGGADERLLVWTDHRPDGDELDPTVVDQCATTRDSSGDVDRALLVTTGQVTSVTRKRAGERGIDIVDCDALARRVVAAGLADGAS